MFFGPLGSFFFPQAAPSYFPTCSQLLSLSPEFPSSSPWGHYVCVFFPNLPGCLVASSFFFGLPTLDRHSPSFFSFFSPVPPSVERFMLSGHFLVLPPPSFPFFSFFERCQNHSAGLSFLSKFPWRAFSFSFPGFFWPA